jgi:DNA-directed RNA polymerase specialized sigma24 family protein
VNNEVLEQRFRELSLQLISSRGYPPEHILKLIEEERTIPVTVFSTELSPLQALVTYLRETQNLDFHTISELLGRSYRAVWGAYQQGKLDVKYTEVFVPLNIFTDQLSILEALVKELKDVKKLKYSQIARLLNKDDRTVWTTYKRAIIKCQG